MKVLLSIISGFSVLFATMSVPRVLQEDTLPLPPLNNLHFAIAKFDPAHPEKLKVTRSMVKPELIVPQTELRSEEYTVRVPFTELVEEDGVLKPVTRYRLEERTRDVPVITMKPKKTDKKQGVFSYYEMAQLNFYSAEDFAKIEQEEIKTLFSDSRAIVLLDSHQKLDSFLSLVLKDDVIIVQKAPSE